VGLNMIPKIEARSNIKHQKGVEVLLKEEKGKQ
jgi:hypothetical protein